MDCENKIQAFVVVVNKILKRLAPVFPDGEVSYTDNCYSPVLKVERNNSELGDILGIVGLRLNREGLEGPAVEVHAQGYFSNQVMLFSQFLENPLESMIFTFDGEYTMSDSKLTSLIEYIVAIAYMPTSATSFVEWIRTTKADISAFIQEGTEHRERIAVEYHSSLSTGYYSLQIPTLNEVSSRYADFIAQPLPFLPHYNGDEDRCAECENFRVCAKTVSSDDTFCLDCYPAYYARYHLAAKQFLMQ